MAGSFQHLVICYGTNAKSQEWLPKQSVLFVEQCLRARQHAIFMLRRANAKVLDGNPRLIESALYSSIGPSTGL